MRSFSLVMFGLGLVLLAACGPGGLTSGEFGTESSDDAHDDDDGRDGQGDDETTAEHDPSAGETTGDGDGDGEPASACDAWQAAVPIETLPPDACLTQGSQPLLPEPPQGPFPAEPGEVVCGSGWGHGVPTPSFDWSVELDTFSGNQFLSLTPDAEMLIISDSYQGDGGEVLRYDAETSALVDELDVSDVFVRPRAIAALDHDRWIVLGEREGSDSYSNDSIVVEMQLGAVAWQHLLSTQDFQFDSLTLTANGDIVVAGQAASSVRVDRLGSDGSLLWTWTYDLSTPTRPHVTETPDGRIIVSASLQVLGLSADGELVQQLVPLSFRHMAATAVGNDLLLVGNGHDTSDPDFSDPDFTWLEAARWSRSSGEVEWLREHRRALSWNGSTNLYNAIYAVVPHPCGGVVVAGSLAVESSSCTTQPWVAALDDAGEIIWADRIHRCGGRPGLAVSPAGDVWVLVNSATDTRPLLRRYSLG